MTTFVAEEAKVAVHSSLSLLLGQLAVFLQLRRKVRLVAVGRAGGRLSGVGSAVEKPKGYRQNWICAEFMFCGEVSVDETVS